MIFQVQNIKPTFILQLDIEREPLKQEGVLQNISSAIEQGLLTGLVPSVDPGVEGQWEWWMCLPLGLPIPSTRDMKGLGVEALSVSIRNDA